MLQLLKPILSRRAAFVGAALLLALLVVVLISLSRSGQGFLGTNAPPLADVSLVMGILVAVMLTVGVVMARRKRFETHRWIQTSAVTLNVTQVLTVMIASFFKSAAPGIPEKLDESYYLVALIHGTLGLGTLLFGTFVALRGNSLVPQALRFKRRYFKPFMRTAYGLYMLVTLLGVWVYLTWYTGSAAAGQQPLAQGENELIVPMANFDFAPTQAIIPVGATVVWVNQDGAPHTATSDDGQGFNSDLLSAGQSFKQTFSAVGEFPYFCELHGAAGGIGMSGTIKVVPADEAPALVAARPTIEAPTPQPTPHPLPRRFFGEPSGTAAFRDAQGRSDQLVIDLEVAEEPPQGTALTAFLTTADGADAQNLGALELDGSGGARLEYTAPDGGNLAARFSRIVLSYERRGSTADAPAGTPVFEGRLPDQAFAQISRLLADGPGLPERQGYATGIRLQTDELLSHSQLLRASQEAGDLAGLRRHAEHVFNLIAGSLDPRFGDRNGDGRSQNAGDGFGLLQNSQQAGYIQATLDAADAAGGTPDADEAIIVHAEHVRVSAENMQGWAREAYDLALQLTQAPDAGTSAAQAQRLLELAEWLDHGLDANGNGMVEPVPGEAGGVTLYEHAQFLAGFGIFPAE